MLHHLRMVTRMHVVKPGFNKAEIFVHTWNPFAPDVDTVSGGSVEIGVHMSLEAGEVKGTINLLLYSGIRLFMRNVLTTTCSNFDHLLQEDCSFKGFKQVDEVGVEPTVTHPPLGRHGDGLHSCILRELGITSPLPVFCFNKAMTNEIVRETVTTFLPTEAIVRHFNTDVIIIFLVRHLVV